MSNNSVVINGVKYFKPCNWFLSGHCKNGDDCAYLHVSFCPDCLNKKCNGKCGWPQATPILNMRKMPIAGVWRVDNDGTIFEFAFRTDAMMKEFEARKQARIQEEQAAEAKERVEKIAAIQKANANAVPYVSPAHTGTEILTKNMDNLVARAAKAVENPAVLLFLEKEYFNLSNQMSKLIAKMKETHASVKKHLNDVSDEDKETVTKLSDALFSKTK